VEPRERALLDYAAKLTVRPWTCTRADIEALRAHGWSDEDILDANQVVCYFNLLTRTIDGLGVEVEEGRPTDESYLAEAAALRDEILAGRAP
jgi:alkylhydroperoxidase family enzyme